MYQPIQTPRHLISGFLAVLLAMLVSACGQESNNTTGTEVQGAAAPAKAERTTGAQPAVQRNLSTFDLCARLPAADVAGILGATPERTSAKATMMSYATDCTYAIERGDGMKDYAMIFLYSPQMWDPGSIGDFEKIKGLGDDAYLEKEGLGSFKRIHVLVKGDFMLDARADSVEQARGLAELALERLAGDGG